MIKKIFTLIIGIFFISNLFGGNDAEFVSQTTPINIDTNQVFSYTISFKNTGSDIWPAGDYAIGTINPYDNNTWGVGNRVYTTSDIAPNETFTITINLTAPNTPGFYDLQWRMIEVGVEWFGEESTNINVPVHINNSEFVSQTTPVSIDTNQVFSYTVSFKNTGSSTWTVGNYYVGTQNPQDNSTWGVGTRVSIPNDVAPGETLTVTMNLTAPSTPGFYDLQWKMVDTATPEWFGALSTNIGVPVHINNSEYVSQTMPFNIDTNQVFSYTIRFKNTGTSTWTVGNYYVGTQNPQDNSTWGVTNRVAIPNDVAPGEILIVTMDLTSPSTPGFYNLQWRMIDTATPEWFGENSVNINVPVHINNAAHFISQSVPYLVETSETFNTSLTFVNNGLLTWSTGNNYALGVQNPAANTNWGTTRISLPYDVLPGDTVIFNTNLTAPSIEDFYNFQWMMVQDGVEWFGDSTENRNIAVGIPYNVVDSASTLGGDCYNLISGGKNIKGAIWYNDKIDLNKPFDIYFTINLSHTDGGTDADGVMFVLQTAGNNVVGGAGAALGYQGFSPSLGLEIDVYSNSPGQVSNYPELGNEHSSNNPIDHMAISDGGVVNCRIAPPVALVNPDNGSNNIVDGVDRIIRITWDPAYDSIKVWFACDLVIETQWDIINQSMNGENMVYWGFTGSSGYYDAILPKICLDANIMNATTDKTICYGDSVKLFSKAYGATTPVWSSTPPSSNIDLSNPKKPIVWPDTSTTYYVTYELPCDNGMQTDSVFVRVLPPVTAYLSGGDDVCFDATPVDLTIDFGGTAPWTYEWSRGGTPLNGETTNNSQVIIPVSTEGAYLLTNVTDSMGCVAKLVNPDSIGTIVTIYPLPTPEISGDLEFCSGDSTLLDAGAFPHYQWNTSAADTFRILTVKTGGEYIVTVTSDEGCTYSDTVQVTMYAIPNAIVSASPSATLCLGDTITLNASASSGFGDLVYEWSNDSIESQFDIWPTSSQFFTVTVTDNHLCQDTASINVTVNTLPEANAGTVDPTICNGQDVLLDASASFEGIGNLSVTYEWSTGDNTDTTRVNPTSNTFYYVTVTNDKSCTDIDTVEVNVNPLPVIVLTANNTEICNGDTVLIDASNSTGATPFTYVWSTLSDSASTTVMPIADSTFSVTVTDVNTCENFASINIIVNQLPTFTYVDIDVTNCDVPNGEITLIGQDGHPAYEYSIDESGFTSINYWDTLNSVNYVFGVRDNKGCLYYETIPIGNSSGLVVDSVRFTDILCFDDTNSIITIYPNSSSISYSIDNGFTTSSNNIFINNGAGVYPIVIKDNNTNCVASDAVTIPQPTALTNYFTKYDIKCFGDNTGSAVANYGGGTPYLNGGLHYTISEDFVTDSISGLYADTYYYITITDSNHCELKDSVILTQPTELVIDSMYKSDLVCYNDYSGEVVVAVLGGVNSIVNPYIYNWQETTVTDSILTNLSAGWYHITVVDNNLCTVEDSVILTQPDSLILTPFSKNTICAEDNGIASVSVVGGTPEYSYSWNNTTLDNDTITGLIVGDYRVVVTDSHACTDSISFVIEDQSTGILSVTDKINVDCYGDSTASIYVEINGGTPKYTYSWYSGTDSLVSHTTTNTTNNIQNLSEGSYTIQVTDSMNCTTSIESIYINQNSPIKISYSAIDVLCNNEENGEISTTVIGGVQPYSYLWNNNDTTAIVEDLISGYYSILIIDSLNCNKLQDSIYVGNPEKLILEIDSTTNLTCHNSNNGSIEFNVVGGLPDYKYFINNEEVSDTYLNTLSAGDYLIEVFDQNSCVSRDSFSLTQPDELVIIDSIVENNIYLKCIGGTPEYNYLWDNGAMTSSLTNLLSGIYGVTVTDSNNCEALTMYRIHENIKIPSVITPNGDNKNDTWEVKGISAYKEVNIHIFNRWGDEIYLFDGSGEEYLDKSKQWDGTWNNKELPLGTYLYILRKEEENKELTGTVTIVR